MKKVWIYVAVFVGLAIALTVGIYNDVEAMRKQDRLDYWDFAMSATSMVTDMKWLGLVDTKQISRDTGCIYNGPAIHAELVKRAGISEDSDTWTFNVQRDDYVAILKMTVYEDGQEDIPVFDRKIKCEYLWGEIL